MGVLRRYATDAGESWRKWEDPLAPGRALRAKREGRLVRAVLFWLICVDLGALAVLAAR